MQEILSRNTTEETYWLTLAVIKWSQIVTQSPRDMERELLSMGVWGLCVLGGQGEAKVGQGGTSMGSKGFF